MFLFHFFCLVFIFPFTPSHPTPLFSKIFSLTVSSKNSYIYTAGNRCAEMDINWVVSFAEEFTESAVPQAQENGIVLINGRDFCKMLIAAGLDI